MTVRTVTARITKYYHRRGEGFAETHDIDGRPISVLFRAEGVRVLEMGRGEYMVGIDRDHEANPRALGRDPMWLIMEVYRTEKGWRSNNWSVRPPMTVEYLLPLQSVLSIFVGGQIQEQFINSNDVVASSVWTSTIAHLRLNGVSLHVGTNSTNCRVTHGSYALSNATYTFEPDGSVVITIIYAKCRCGLDCPPSRQLRLTPPKK